MNVDVAIVFPEMLILVNRAREKYVRPCAHDWHRDYTVREQRENRLHNDIIIV